LREDEWANKQEKECEKSIAHLAPSFQFRSEKLRSKRSICIIYQAGRLRKVTLLKRPSGAAYLRSGAGASGCKGHAIIGVKRGGGMLRHV
jgi:hypothetical protein